MFGTVHILYMVISLALSVGILIILYKKCITDESRTRALRFFAIVTVLIHISPLWVDYFTEGTATADSTMLLPIHPCNVCMWLLVITSFIKKRDTLFFKAISEFTFLGGTVCGIIGIVLNENFGNNPTLTDYDVLKGLLSHSTMVLGCVYLLISGIVKIRVSNVVSVAMGLLFFVVDGAIINSLHRLFGLDAANSMYLEEPPFPDLPWITTLTIGIFGVVFAFVITAIYEQVSLPKEKRWYSRREPNS